jgi:hypothetical protein
MIKTIFTFAVLFICAFLFNPVPAGAESIGGISLGDNISKVQTSLGKPSEKQDIGKNQVKYIWEKGDNILKVVALNNLVEYVQASAGISSKGETKTFATKKGIYPGSLGKAIEKLYGKARADYVYPSEDCFVFNYKTGKNEQLIFRIYGFADRGAVVIDVILCRPGYSKDKIWKEN